MMAKEILTESCSLTHPLVIVYNAVKHYNVGTHSALRGLLISMISLKEWILPLRKNCGFNPPVVYWFIRLAVCEKMQTVLCFLSIPFLVMKDLI